MYNGSVEQHRKEETTTGRVTLLPEYRNVPMMEFEKGGALTVKNVGDRTFTNKKNVENNSQLKSGLYNVKEVYENGEKIIVADFVLPNVEYRYPEIEKVVKEYAKSKDETILSAEIGELQDNIYETTTIQMDRLTVVSDGGEKIGIFSGAKVLLMYAKDRNYLVNTGVINLTPQANLIGRDVLYSKNETNKARNYDKIYVRENALNSVYGTTADVYYKTVSKLENGVLKTDGFSTEAEVVIADEVGNSITVHTPVVNKTKLDVTQANIKNNQLISSSNVPVLVFDREFEVTIPNSGQHITLRGYGEKEYNYNGVVRNDSGTEFLNTLPKDTFAKAKQIRFEFDVYQINKQDGSKKYLKKNEWHDLEIGETSFNFMIPVWEEEVWKGRETKFETRVIAENCQDTENEDVVTKENANTNPAHYIVKNEIDVKIVGELYDLQIRATNDPDWKNLKSVLTVKEQALGQKGQSALGAYQYGIKLGYKAYFDLKTKGSRGDRSETIEIVPEYYFVSSDGKTVKEVDVYYHSTKQRYVKMAETPMTLSMQLSNTNGSTLNPGFNQELATATRIQSGKYNYAATRTIGLNGTGDSQFFKLDYSLRLPYANAVKDSKKLYNNDEAGTSTLPKTEDEVLDSIGRWYGEFRLPSTTLAVDKSIPNARAQINSNPSDNNPIFLKNGYIVVLFDTIETKTADGTRYLSYDKPDDNPRWKSEEGKATITLPNGNKATMPDYGSVIIYEANRRANSDAEIAGTH